MLYKTTSKLFRGTYQYKIVLVCPGSSLFRHNNLDRALSELSKIVISSDHSRAFENPYYAGWRSGFKTQDDIDYAFKLHHALSGMPDVDIRVESPWVGVYANDLASIELLANLDTERVKYISRPPKNTSLVEGTILLPKVDFEYRITLGKTTQDHDAFVQWADSNSKVKLTKSCKKDLVKQRSWGGTYFYITGANNLLLAKMHLGGSIAKIERIVKQ
jgi:hypothetical protein